jgi:hypothetical protein
VAVPGEPGEFCPKRRVELPLCVPSARANCKKTSLHARDARLCARSFRGGLKTLILSGAREAARVTLNRPERRSALSLELTDELVGVLQSLGARPDVPATQLDATVHELVAATSLPPAPVRQLHGADGDDPSRAPAE